MTRQVGIELWTRMYNSSEMTMIGTVNIESVDEFEEVITIIDDALTAWSNGDTEVRAVLSDLAAIARDKA